MWRKPVSDQGKGTLEDPFLTINKAASVAMAGDTIIVHEGVYREWVKPKNKGIEGQEKDNLYGSGRRKGGYQRF